MAGKYTGQDPLVVYGKRNTELCPDFFIHQHCMRGELCHFAHDIMTLKCHNKRFKTNFCPKFYNGTCQRGVLCNFTHDPNKIKNPTKKYSGAALIRKLENLNPYGYGDHYEQNITDLAKKVEKVQIREDCFNAADTRERQNNPKRYKYIKIITYIRI